ncbi:MAG: 30S ribosomal protein S7 [Candidatus Micrarchaeota archaeon]|nr:30S ribosomal protein S7 [Candidatus Micrarchaeota archaeon]
MAFSESLLFGKYSLKEVTVNDPSLANYIILVPKAFPNTFGRRKNRVYYVTHVNIIERLMNKLMRGGTGQKIGGKVIRTKGALQGKKVKVMHIVEDAFEAISKKAGKNPAQVLVNALENTAPIEDTTRIRYGGINYNVAVGISAARRLDVALRNMALASLIGAFKSKKSLADALADELVLAANKDPNSYAIKKKVELERIARSAR